MLEIYQQMKDGWEFLVVNVSIVLRGLRMMTESYEWMSSSGLEGLVFIGSCCEVLGNNSASLGNIRLLLSNKVI